jgi:hypothetical protein
MSFEDRQRDAMTDFNRSSYSIRELLIAAHKRAQDEADIRKYELEDYERANGFRRAESNVQRMQFASGCRCADPALICDLRGCRCAVCGEPVDAVERLDASRAYREVTGRDASAGAETYTRRNAEDIHD